jgi:hypothetical protein
MVLQIAEVAVVDESFLIAVNFDLEFRSPGASTIGQGSLNADFAFIFNYPTVSEGVSS